MTNIINKIIFLFSIFSTFVMEILFALFHRSKIILIKRLAFNLSKKNILYVKLFQAFAMNKNLIDDETNNELYSKYKQQIDGDKFIFGGRLADYKYYDMHQVVGSALERALNQK